MTKEELKEQDIRLNRLCFDYQEKEKRIAEQEELLNSTLDENKEIYKKMADLDTALENCTESLTDARIKIKELEKENEELKERNAKLKEMYAHSAREAGTYKQFLELKEKENANLEEKISNLLSCKSCPENKGGLLCQKEYEGKCLLQKIQYIKELKEEIAELEKELEQAKKVQVVEHFEAYGQCRDSRRIAGLEKENAELKEQNYKTKVALRNVIDYLGQFCSDYPDCVIEAEIILKEIEND